MLKRENGFTLLEVVITVAIAGIVFLAIASFSILAARLNTAANDLGKAQHFAQITMQAIESELRFAKSLDIKTGMPNSPKEDEHYIFLKDGGIFKKFGEYESDYIASPLGFEDYTLSVTFSPANEKVINVSISVVKNAKSVYTLKSNIQVNNLIFLSITGEQQGTCVGYKLQDIPVSSIIVTSPDSTITQSGRTMQMSAEVYPQNATVKGVAWSVDKQDCAHISQEGLLTPLKNGVVTVTATALDGSGVSGSKQIIIDYPVITITDVTLATESGETTLRRYGNTLRIIPTITPANATNRQLTWSVDNTNYATIDQNGVLTSGNKNNKSVMVRASTNDGSGITATIEIRITN